MVTPQELLARAEALVPRLLERAARTDTERRVPAETVQEMRDAELFGIMQPVEYGGFAMRPIDFFKIARTLARGCPSTGWIYAVLAGHSGYLAAFPKQARIDVWGGDRSNLLSSAYAPTGSATPIDGGFMLQGRFPFSSGCDYASWAFVGARVNDSEGSREARNFLVPISSFTIIDDWQTLGLRGTGSKTLQAENVFVPGHCVLPSRRLDFTTTPFSLCAVAVGIAEGAIDRFVEHTEGRASPITGLKAAESEIIQGLLAESTAEVEAAWLLLARDVNRGYDQGISGQAPADLDKARNRRDQAYVGQLAARAVDRLYSACGGSGIYSKSPMQRVFRDIHSAVLHPTMSWELAAPQAGRVFLNSEYVSAF